MRGVDAALLIDRLFDAFNRRDAAAVTALCDERVEFSSVTAEFAGRSEPYRGHQGLRQYFADVAQIWDELLVTANEVRTREDAILVVGHVYARSRQLGIRDIPAAWVWRLEGELLVEGAVYSGADEALAALEPSGPRPGMAG
jgi:ketosteroid isomerase-like protein